MNCTATFQQILPPNKLWFVVFVKLFFSTTLKIIVLLWCHLIKLPCHQVCPNKKDKIFIVKPARFCKSPNFFLKNSHVYVKCVHLPVILTLSLLFYTGPLSKGRGTLLNGRLWVCTDVLSQRAQAETWTQWIQTWHPESTGSHRQFNWKWVWNCWK